MTPLAGTVPVLSSDETRALEQKLFAGDEAREWPAMQQAGCAVARAVLRDFAEIGGFPPEGTILVLVGKGHNGGDALIAATAVLEQFPRSAAQIVFAFGERALRPLAARAWRALQHVGGDRVTVISTANLGSANVALCLDGVFGFQCRPPVDAAIGDLLETVNALPVRLRAAVDLPSADRFKADFTYATGCVKIAALDSARVGRLRYLDLGFFAGNEPGRERVLTTRVLAPLAELRTVESDKRTFGHVFVIGGSRSFPGAVLMTVLAALQSGAGLVTAFVPESVAAAFAARAPEAMWVAWPESPTGGLALEGEHLLQERLERASALVLGPGLGREPETLALARSIAQASPVPLVIDADALQPEIVAAGDAPRILTPHTGEFARISGGMEWRAFARQSTGRTLVLKGPRTRVAAGDTVYHSCFGGPVLARGGSGDLLAGLIGGLLAQSPDGPVLTAARGVVWHGHAADLLARAHGQTSIRVTQLLDFLPIALREL
jgi:ADP-dependent NAD(P)H-hydrate dehydratase / NAD(P)H-hydrate epimerase